MGFRHDDRSDFQIPVSDTQAYRQFGNAVVVPVVSSVAELMKPHILSSLENRGTRSLRNSPNFLLLQEPDRTFVYG